MAFFHPDDPRAGVYGSYTTQSYAALYKHRTDDSVRFIGNELTNTQNIPYYPEKRKSLDVFEKHEIILKGINTDHSRFFINSPIDEDRVIIHNGIEKLKEILNNDEINIIKSLVVNKTTPSIVKEHAISVTFFSYLYRDSPLERVQEKLTLYIRKLSYNSYLHTKNLPMDECDKLANKIFNTISNEKNHQPSDYFLRVEEYYKNSVTNMVKKKVGKLRKIVGSELAREYEPAIKNSYDEMLNIITDKNVNRLMEIYYAMNTVHNLSNYISYILKIKEEKKCIIL